MKTFKKTLSLILCVCIVASVAAVATFSASANYGVDGTHRLKVTDVVPEDIETKTFRFYMPYEWRNDLNDAYDGVSLDSCKAGIYWWDTSYNCELPEYQNDTGKGWPGYIIPDTDPDDSNIFVVKVPADTVKVIFNNTVDGSDDPADPSYVKAFQIDDAPAEYYDPNEDGYGFYPDGTTTFDGMIYVCNMKLTPDAGDGGMSQKEKYKGCWFYYYGQGEYGIYPTRAEAEANNGIYKNGDFPAYGLQVDETAEVEVGATTTIDCNDNTATAVSADPSVATVTKDEATGKFTVKGVKAGTTTITFTVVKDGESETAECKVTVKAKAATTPTPPAVTKKANTMTVKVASASKLTVKLKKGKKATTKKTTIKALTVSKAKGAVTYKVTSKDKKKVLTFSKGKVTVKKGAKKGTYTIKVKVTAKGNANYKSKSVTKTIKVKVKK